MQIVDRRLNPKSKSLGNRQRFLRRAKAEIREAIKDSLKSRKVSEAEGSEEVTIRSKSLREPSFSLGRNIGARPCLDHGELCVWVAHRTSRLGLLWFALAALLGQLHRVHGLDHLRTSELRVASSHARQRVATDGEVEEMDMPLHYRSLPRALRVLVPESPP